MSRVHTCVGDRDQHTLALIDLVCPRNIEKDQMPLSVPDGVR